MTDDEQMDYTELPSDLQQMDESQWELTPENIREFEKRYSARIEESLRELEDEKSRSVLWALNTLIDHLWEGAAR